MMYCFRLQCYYYVFTHDEILKYTSLGLFSRFDLQARAINPAVGHWHQSLEVISNTSNVYCKGRFLDGSTSSNDIQWQKKKDL